VKLTEASEETAMVHSVLIVDDNAFIRHQLRQVFDGQLDFQVCGEAENGREAIQIAEELLPETVIIDLSMPVMNGLDAARIIKNTLPETKIILFSNHGSIFSEREARSAGFSAVVSKAENVSELLGKTREAIYRAVLQP
jgi:DNA-binding NarL/FixJ family response regulator